MRTGCFLLIVCLPLAVGSARAAHPLQTEDTGTQGIGHVELENGLDRLHGADGSGDFSWQPQLSWGLAPTLDLIVQPAWERHRDAEGTRRRGAADTKLDAKWRFLDGAPWSIALRAGVAGGQGRTAAHGLLALSVDAAPFTVHANVGATQNPNDAGQRRRIAAASAALMWKAGERWILTVDGGAHAHPDPSRRAWPGLLLGGAIYTVRQGLDLDAGWQASVGAAPVRTRELLLGLTWRFAMP